MNIPNYILELPPTGTNHAYHTSNGRWYKDDRIITWEKIQLYKLRDVIPMQLRHEGLCVNIGFYDADKRRRDIDGRIKFVLDLLQKAGFYKDDSMITDLFVSKRYDKANPRMEVSVY